MGKITRLGSAETDPEVEKRLQERWARDDKEAEELAQYLADYMTDAPAENIFELRKRNTIVEEIFQELEELINKPLKR